MIYPALNVLTGVRLAAPAECNQERQAYMTISIKVYENAD